MDDRLAEQILQEILCIRSEVKAYKLESRAELGAIKQDLQEIKNRLNRLEEMLHKPEEEK